MGYNKEQHTEYIYDSLNGDDDYVGDNDDDSANGGVCGDKR